MEKEYSESKDIILRLTYLWAFVESGLGGMMHLLHIPLTGFIIGGISVIINVFIASYSRVNVKTMLGSLGLVLLCKFALSPHSPLGAYVAVSFQGILALLIFSLMGIQRWSILLYAVIVMFENALQKPIMAYLIFGDELVQAIILTVNKFFKNNQHTEKFLTGLTSIYFATYIIWGLIIAYWAHLFLNSIEDFKMENTMSISQRQNYTEKTKGHGKVLWSILIVSIVFFFLFSYFSSAKIHWALYLLKVLVWFLLLAIILPYILRFILKHFIKKSESTIIHSLSSMPKIKENFHKSFDLANKEKGLKKIRNFIFYSIYLNVFYTTHEP